MAVFEMSMRTEILSRARNLPGVVVLAMALTACGGGGGSGGDVFADSTDSGIVGDVVTSPDNGSTGDVVTGSPSPGSGGGTVPGVSVGTASLSWNAPLYRADGQPLSPGEIQGYRIYYGTATGNYDNTLDVTDGSVRSFVVSNLPLGIYYFVLTTLDLNGRESTYSNEAVKTVTS